MRFLTFAQYLGAISMLLILAPTIGAVLAFVLMLIVGD